MSIEKQYNNLYQLLSRQTIPENCLPYKNRRGDQRFDQILQVNKTITDFMINQRHPLEKMSSKQHIMNATLDIKHSPKRIHHNKIIVGQDLAKIDKHQRQKQQQKTKSIFHKGKPDILERQINEYMKQKSNDQEFLTSYLKDKGKFISEVCQQIKHKISTKSKQNKEKEIENQKEKEKKRNLSLPKMDDIPKLLSSGEFTSLNIKQKRKVSLYHNKNATYLTQLGQIRKNQQLERRNRERTVRVFKRKIFSLDKIKRLHSIHENQQ